MRLVTAGQFKKYSLLWMNHGQSWFFLAQLDVYWVAGCVVAFISLLILALYQNRTDFLNNPCTFTHKIYFSVATKSKVPGDLAVYTGFVVAVCVFTCVLLVIVFVLYYKKQQLHCAVHTSVIPGKNNRFFYLTFFLIASLNSAPVEPVLVTFFIFSVYWLSLNKQNKKQDWARIQTTAF